MLEFRPDRSNNKANGMIVVLFIGAVAILFLCGFLGEIPFRWVFQLFAVLFFVAAIYLLTRYVTRSYIYRIELSEGSSDLTVTELSGKRQITVCRISICGIKETAIIDMTADGKDRLREMKKKKGKTFDYRVDLAPERSILILTDEGYEGSMLLLAYDERLWAEISREDQRG